MALLNTLHYIHGGGNMKYVPCAVRIKITVTLTCTVNLILANQS